MKNFTSCICILGLSGVAFGDVVMDQIGPDDGSNIGANITGCQDFEAAYDIYDIATLDNFTGAGEVISMVEMVLNGWNGFVDPSSVIGYTSNLHSTPTAASLDLIGDIATSYADAADATISSTWLGAGFNVMMPADMAAASGDNWVSMIPANAFGTNGQTGTADALVGDGVMGWQANPGGGFGMPGNMQEMTNEAAYRIHSAGDVDPCNYDLGYCPADINDSGLVDVDDILAIIGTFGQGGDGTFRPAGDIFPLPNGDCAVTVDDILALIGAFGDDCTPRGACCASDGTCSDDISEADCLSMEGDYAGDDSSCADITCASPYSGCPDGADADCDDCWVDGDDSSTDCNAGLNGDGSLDALTIGVPLCGTISVYFDPNIDNGDGTFGATLRDTDWFSNAALNAGGTFTLNCETENTGVIFGIVDLDAVVFVEYITVVPGEVVMHTFGALAPGNYSFWAGASEWNTEWTCANGANYWMQLDGDGAAMGACCVGTTCAGENSMSDCDTLGGQWTYAATCADVNDCQTVYGACCVGSDTCLDGLSDEDCAGFGGDFMGLNTVCADLSCAPNPYDQIGANDGTDIGVNITACQIFEAANSAYDIATLDNFSFDASTHVVAIEAVITGWNGFVNISPVTNYTISVYSSPDAAGTDLVGDVYAIDIVAPNLPTWTGAGELVSFDIDITLPAGEYYFAVIPWNDFGINGQTGISDYAGGGVGDGVFWQANPNEGFGFGPWQQGAGDSAYRLTVE